MSWPSIIEETPGLIKKVEVFKPATPSKPVTPAKRRPFLGLKADFDAQKHLTDAGQKRLKTLDEYLARYRKMTLDARLMGGFYEVDAKGSYVIKSGKPVFTLYPEGVLDVYSLRNVAYVATRWLCTFDELGRGDDLRELVIVADNIERRMQKTPQGFRQYPNWRENTNERPLDQLLVTGWLAGIDRALWENRDSPLVPKEVQERFSRMMNEDILKGLFYRALEQSKEGGASARAARLALWKSAGCNRPYDPNDKSTLSIRQILDLFKAKGLYTAYDRYGGAIYHPLMSLHCFAQIRSGQYGWDEDKDVAERTGKQLLACRKLVDSPKGVLEQHPHFVPERVRYIDMRWETITPEKPDNEYGFVDITYPREASQTEELARRAGSKYCTETLAGGFARSVAWCALPDGSKSKYAAATTGGSGLALLSRKRVISLEGGKTVLKDAPYLLTNPTTQEAISQITRGDNALGVRFADKATQEVIRELNDRLDVGDQGHALSLLLCETKRL